MENSSFAASLTITKLDASTGEKIDGGVTFNLKWVSGDTGSVTYNADEQGVTENPYKAKDEGTGEIVGVTKEIGSSANSTETGTVTFDGLMKGTYTLTEVSAQGYEVNGTDKEPYTATVVVSENGVTVTQASGAEGSTGSVTNGNTNSQWDYTSSVTVSDEPITVSFTKRLIGDTLETGMENAEFTITGGKLLTVDGFTPEQNADGTFSGSFTTGSTGTFTLTGALVSGVEYTLTETREPEGAMSVNTETQDQFVFTFTVDESGVVSIVKNGGTNDPHLTYEENEDLVTVWDVPAALAVYKRKAVRLITR